MARFPNFLYSDSNVSPWGQFGKSLGQALFGDPAEIRAQQSAASEGQLRELQMQKMQFDLDTAAQDRADNVSIGALLQHRVTGAGGAPAAALAPPPAAAPTLEAAAPAPAAPGLYNGAFDQNASVAAPPQVGPTNAAAAMLPHDAPLNLTGSSTGPAMAMDTAPDFYSQAAQLESTSDPHAFIKLPDGTRDPHQTASGLYGFTDPTWQGQGGQGSAMDADASEQTFRYRQLADHAFKTLQAKLGRDPTEAEVYAMTRFGEGGGQQVLDADPSASLASLFSQGTMDQNADLSRSGTDTAGGWLQKANADFGVPQPDLGIQTAAGGPTPAADPTAVAATPAVQGQPSPIAHQTGPKHYGSMEELVNDLNDFEVYSIYMAHDKKKALQDVLEKRSALALKGELSSGGLFSGTGLPNQSMNIIRNYELAKSQGYQPTPAETYDYEWAKYALQYRPPMTQSSDDYGNPVTQPYTPAMPSGPPLPLPTPPGATPAPMPAAPAPAPAAGAPAAPNAGGLGPSTSAPIQGKTPALAGDAARALAAAQVSIGDVQSALNYLMKDGKIDPTRLRGTFQTSGESTLGKIANDVMTYVSPEGQNARNSMNMGLSGMLAAFSGQSVTANELPRWAQLLVPSAGENVETAAPKLLRLQKLAATLTGLYQYGHGGMLTLDQIYDIATKVEVSPEEVKAAIGGAGGGADAGGAAAAPKGPQKVEYGPDGKLRKVPAP